MFAELARPGFAAILALAVAAAVGRPTPTAPRPREPAPILHRRAAEPTRCVSLAIAPGMRIVRGTSNCTGDTVFDIYEIEPDGHVEWSRGLGPTRRIWLTWQELDRLAHVERLSCAAVQGLGWFRIDRPGDHGDGTLVRLHSELGDALEDFFDGIKARYYTRRSAELGHVELQLALEADRDVGVRIVDHRVSVSVNGQRAIDAVELDDETLVDVIDRLLEVPQGPDDAGAAVLRGTLTAAGTTTPIRIGRAQLVTYDVIGAVLGDAVSRAGFQP
ncbi:MAG TPA: hypothetical protein VMJ10_04915 [Kofleriaceae bacterium]|nr:hypothetical protein [Kofleriaceae bacterium]